MRRLQRVNGREMFRHLPFPFENERFPIKLGAVVQKSVLTGEQPAREVIHAPDGSWLVGDGSTTRNCRVPPLRCIWPTRSSGTVPSRSWPACRRDASHSGPNVARHGPSAPSRAGTTRTSGPRGYLLVTPAQRTDLDSAFTVCGISGCLAARSLDVMPRHVGRRGRAGFEPPSSALSQCRPAD